MALLGNGSRHSSTGRITTATTNIDGFNSSCVPAAYNSTAFFRNRLVGEAGISPVASVPDGCRHPVAWVMPQKPGGLSSRNSVIGSGAASGPAQSGYNIDANITGDGGVSSAPLGLIVMIAATITASGGISSATTQALATLVASITGSGSVAATAQGLADLGAVLTGAGSVTANNSALMDITANIVSYGDLTPEGIRDTVWNAILAGYQGDGTAGKALSTAGSGGVDYDALWASMPAATREAIAAAILAAAEVDPIHANVKQVNDIEVTGTGTELDPWNPL